MFDLQTPVDKLYLVGPARAKLLNHLGIHTLSDLLFYFPRFHQDLSRFSDIAELKPNEIANIKARVLTVKNFRTKVRRLTITHALVEDDTGTILCVWFNQPFLEKVIKQGEQFIFSGKIALSKNKLQMQNPIYEQVKQEQVHTARLVPVYPLTARLTQKQLRAIIKNYLDKVVLKEHLPSDILRQEKLLDEDTAVKTFHFPQTYADLKQAQKRLAFDEIFQTQLRVLQYKLKRQTRVSFPIKITKTSLDKKIVSLPFALTASQARALKEIMSDLKSPYPANRLLEGDVGSGKTVLAGLSMWAAAQNNLQSVLLAPTEVLAGQHLLSILKLFINDGINIGLLTSSASKINGNPVSRATLLAQIESGQIKIIIGTHALLEPAVKFAKLSLIIIDEQHRFGVEQRSRLNQHANAHLISMTATPIPRTLALTLYGDLDISRLTELPKGRLPIQTTLVSESSRKQTYQFIEEQINQDRQAFVVCPLVEESDKLGFKSVTVEHEKLSKIFPQFKVGLLHGRLKPQEKEKIMSEFKDNRLQILVSTSVIEVGVDVPNATVMIIEGADRFGLAQLHQFRGRVGRSDMQSYCFLFSDDPNADSRPRLQAIVASNNGFELAEKDLEIRGSGNLYGTEQSGYDFKVATLSNVEAVQRSKQYAQEIIANDPGLDQHPLLKQIVDQKPLIHLE